MDTRAAGLLEPFNGSSGHAETEQAVDFRFAIGWSSLLTPTEPAKSAAALVPAPPRIPIEARGPAVNPGAKELPPPAATPETIDEPAPAERPKSASGSEVNWEMVIPKMVRPANRGTVVKEAPPAKPLPASPATPAPQRPAASKTAALPSRTLPPQRTEKKSAQKPDKKSEYVITEYQIPAADTEYFPVAGATSSSLVVNLILVLVSIAVVGIVIWIGMRPASAESVQVESALGQRGWVRQHASPEAGGGQERRLILFRPSINSTDSELEFRWNPNANGIGWAFRARDVSNYYAARLKLFGSGRSATLAEERFTVANGNEGPHYDKVFSVPLSDSALQVKMSVVGSTFTLYLQGEPQDTWTDSTLQTGGLGFLEDHNQPVEVQSLRLAYIKIPQSNFAAISQSLRQSFR